MSKETFTSLSTDELETMLSRAAERGAKEALCKVGLHDEEAGNDIRDLRVLVDGWRGIKRTATRTFVQWLILFILGLIAMGTWQNFHK